MHGSVGALSNQLYVNATQQMMVWVVIWNGGQKRSRVNTIT